MHDVLIKACKVIASTRNGSDVVPALKKALSPGDFNNLRGMTIERVFKELTMGDILSMFGEEK